MVRYVDYITKGSLKKTKNKILPKWGSISFIMNFKHMSKSYEINILVGAFILINISGGSVKLLKMTISKNLKEKTKSFIIKSTVSKNNCYLLKHYKMVRNFLFFVYGRGRDVSFDWNKRNISFTINDIIIFSKVPKIYFNWNFNIIFSIKINNLDDNLFYDFIYSSLFWSKFFDLFLYEDDLEENDK